MNTEHVKLSQIKANSANPRTITDAKFKKLVNSVLVFPKMLEIRPIVVDDTFVVLGGNMRLRALIAIEEMLIDEIAEGLTRVKEFERKTEAEKQQLVEFWGQWLDNPTAFVVKASELSDEECKAFVIKDNVGFGDWDMDALANEWEATDLDEWGLDVWQDNNENEGESNTSDNSPAYATLNDRFVVPPFSILDTRRGYWQARKKMWRELIGDMGGSREDTLFSSPEINYRDLYQRTHEHRKELGVSFKEYLDKYVPNDIKEREARKAISFGVSLFDPVLSEICCRWFTPGAGAKIFDCFAGDTQKGVVFGLCDYEFTGIELRQEQVDINNRVLASRSLPVKYICDDGRNVAKYFDTESQDLLFSCPPYFNLEHYSDLENDASNQKSYEEFIQILHDAFVSAIGCLKDNRFAVIVVGDIRSKDGFYYDFVGDIKRIFNARGMPLYNEMILVETGASLPLRAGRYMDARKVAKMHQNILVFYKGNPKDIKKHYPKIEFTQDELELFDKEQGGEEETTNAEEYKNE